MIIPHRYKSLIIAELLIWVCFMYILNFCNFYQKISKLSVFLSVLCVLNLRIILAGSVFCSRKWKPLREKDKIMVEDS